MQLNHRRSRKQFFHQLPPRDHPPVDPPPNPRTRVATTARLDPPPHPGGLFVCAPPELADESWNYTRATVVSSTHQTEPPPGAVVRTRPPEVAGDEWNTPPKYVRAGTVRADLFVQQPVNVRRSTGKPVVPIRPRIRRFVRATRSLPPLEYPAFAPRLTLPPDPLWFKRRSARSPYVLEYVPWQHRVAPAPLFIPRLVASRFVHAEALAPSPGGCMRRAPTEGTIAALRGRVAACIEPLVDRKTRQGTKFRGELRAPIILSRLARSILAPPWLRNLGPRDRISICFNPLASENDVGPWLPTSRFARGIELVQHQRVRAWRRWHKPPVFKLLPHRVAKGGGEVFYAAQVARRLMLVTPARVMGTRLVLAEHPHYMHAKCARNLLALIAATKVLPKSRFLAALFEPEQHKAWRRPQFATGLIAGISAPWLVRARTVLDYTFAHADYTSSKRATLLRALRVSAIADIRVGPAVRADIIVSVELEDTHHRPDR